VIVDEEEVAAIVAKQTGIPITRLTEGETEKVLKMEEALKISIVGQDEAVSTVCRAIRRSRADIKDPNRPIGAFLFLGPTGVGKTLLAKQLAINMFGGEDALIQVDMSEYMEKFAVSRMTGSPPGYVGHEEGGQLTEQVRQRPYSVVLFDEIEKAHPDVMNLLLQVLEEGRLTDAFGRKIDFRNTIIIMTSNLGADLIRRSSEMGFGVSEGMLDFKSMQEKIEGAVRKNLKPEFVNRLDGVVIFRPLDRVHLQLVIDLEIKKLQARLARKNVFITLDEKAKDLLVSKGFQPEMGARPLRRVIEQQLEDTLAEKLLLNPGKGGNWLITVEGDKFVFIDQAPAGGDAKNHLAIAGPPEAKK
jgi:ATP-dependent Clp protease ATP-binding subunit ClpC